MQQCTICAHKELTAIDHALLQRISTREIERRFAVGRASLSRHRRHMPTRVETAAPECVINSHEPVIAQIRGLIDSMRQLIARAQGSGHLQVASQTMRHLAATIELLAKLTGELETAPTAQFNFTLIDSFVRRAEARAAIDVRAEPKEPD